MIDWILVLLHVAAAGAFAPAGYWLGHRAGRRTALRARPEAPKPLVAMCTCGHGYGKHRQVDGHCTGAMVLVVGGDNRTVRELASGEFIECSCEYYDGPDIDTVRMLRGA